MREYVSHYREEDDTYQNNSEHQKNVADLCMQYCSVVPLKKMAYIIGVNHDDGKNTMEAWQPYFIDKVQKKIHEKGEKLDHSTLGGLVIASYEPKSMFAEMAALVVFMHHGVADCVSVSDGSSLLLKREQKYKPKEIYENRAICELEMQKEYEKRALSGVDFSLLCREARRDFGEVVKKIQALPKSADGKKLYGNRDFYLGLCERLLLSVLADGDVRDTVDFTENRVTDTGMSEEEIKKIWERGLRNLEEKLQRMQSSNENKSVLNTAREEISERCKEAAYFTGKRFRLAVPTGAGKTLSALRFALKRALLTGKRHIFYIAPFRSVLEQNADEIRRAVGNAEWVLEHHSDVVIEDEIKNAEYERYIENWDEIPIIATTAVQFFDSIFKAKKQNLRRFHSLCNSIIIFDEVQALPIKVMGLFHLAVNFLTEIGESDVVLCTATQPPFEEIAENRMLPTEWMTEQLSVYEPRFRRVEYHDCTDVGKRSFNIEEAAEFAAEIAEKCAQVLVVFNTKGAARQVFDALQDRTEARLYYLSTDMCAEHRRDKLAEIERALENGERVICVSTQLVEAGVDFSFQSVIRSMAGLDNLIQCAGRCNRHGSEDGTIGNVYLIRMNSDVEKLNSLPEIRQAQDAMEKILRVYHDTPELFDGRLDSEKAIASYYREYYYGKDAEERYPVNVESVRTDIVELLSDNRKFASKTKNVFLKQAFQTAGENFSLIESKPGIDVIVTYKNALKFTDDYVKMTDSMSKRRILRMLQRFTVNISESTLKKMGNDAVYRKGEELLLLDSRYYNEVTGVQTEAGEMMFLDY